MSTSPPFPVLRQLTGLFAAPDQLVAISRMDNGVVVALSPGFGPALGVYPEQALGRTALELGLWRDADARDGVVELIRQRGKVIAEAVSIQARDGRHLDALLTCFPVVVDGIECFFSLVQDIREHHSETAARERELHSHRALIMQSDIGFYRMDLLQRRLVEVNPALARMLGFEDTSSLLAARTDAQLHYLDPADAESVSDHLLRHDHLRDLRTRLLRADGSVLWVSESARLVRDVLGAPLWREGTLVDISRQVAAEQALQHSESLYRSLVENSRDGVFLMQHGLVLFANDALGQILGREPRNIIGGSYFDWIAADDRAAQQERREARERGSDLTQEFEIRLLHSDGSTRLCGVRAGAVQLNGTLASIGTLRDITEERAQQQRLEAAEERYRRLFQHAVLGMFQTSLAGDVVEVNHAMARMFGYASAEQMRLLSPSMLPRYAHAGDRQRLLHIIQREGQVLGEELEMVRLDGSRFWTLCSARLMQPGPTGEAYLEGSLLDSTARHRAEAELRYLASHDSLTQLRNRGSFELLLRQALLESSTDTARSRVVLLLDLDRFKLVNDSLGHAAGDELLVKFAVRLRESVGERAELARYGGDEFALLSRQCLDSKGAVALAHAVQQLLVTPFQLRGQQVFTGASIGIVLLQGFETAAEAVMRDADTAMFSAKARGGGQHALFDNAMHNAVRERLVLETELRFAVERGELQVYYQPICALEDRRLVGLEALVRWQHPSRGLLLPAHFLGVATESGLLPSIDLLVLEQALLQFSRWQRSYVDSAPQRLSVNVSDGLFGMAEFASTVAALLARMEVAPQQLHLEITETVFRSPAKVLQPTLLALKALGVRLVVDDFGTGYSSLVSFSESAFDGLKVDRGFVQDLEHNPRHRAIVRTIAGFADDLELDVVAEGVENEMQAQLLRQLGVRYAQGYLFAPPVAATVLESRLAKDANGIGLSRSA